MAIPDNSILGKDFIVTIEYPDGKILSGKAMATSLTLDTPMVEVTSIGSEYREYIPTGNLAWEIEMMGVGEFMIRDEYKRKVLRKQHADEWRCPYCGRVHPKSRGKCWDGSDGCGAARPMTGVADL